MTARPPTGYERLPGALARDLNEVCNRFERSWQAGERPLIETYLGGASGFERLVLVRELLLVEILYRRRAGDVLAAGDYRGRFPDLGEEWLAEALRVPSDAPTSPSVPSPAARPPVVPGYEILRELGRGGMGVVYQARDTRLDRVVALKFLSEEAARDPRHLERFRREARAAVALNHPAVCTLYDVGEYQGRPFLVLEYVEGQTLRALVGPRPDFARLLPLLRQAAEALRVAHGAGIVHRDLKPENLMVRPDGYVKVLDFGLARLLPAPGGAGPAPASADTDPGTLLGTVQYMSPEQARGEPVDSASDIFSLGVVLYELATGRHPFEAEGRLSTLQAIAAQPAVPLRRLNPEAPAALEALVLQMLHKDPRRRPTAAEVEAVLGESAGGAAGGRDAGAASPRRQTVGRERGLAALEAGFSSAAAGRGLVLCVTGEPGIGKTTLVEEFIRALPVSACACGIGRSHCSERLAGSGAYLPVLEALDNLVHGRMGDTAARLLRAVAPTWYVQVTPPAADDPAFVRLQAEAAGSSPERVKREFLAFLRELTSIRPVLWFLDDVHWADASTVDLLAYLGRQCSEMRLLLVLTYRPSDMLLGQHPFLPLRLELQGRGLCREVPLGFLSRQDVERYLTLAYPRHEFPTDFAAVIHTRTAGNPLFLVDLLRYLGDRGVIARAEGRWVLAGAVPDLQGELPESVRGMIQRKLDQLSAADRRLLMVASVQGQEFDAAVLAQALTLEAAEIEERLEVLERVHAVVRRVRELEYPDHTLTVRYAFVHVLYQNELEASVQPARKAAWVKAVAQAVRGHYRERLDAVAGDLALLFEAARDWAAAAELFLLAAQNAMRLFAHREAATLARRGLGALQKLPGTPERPHLEQRLQHTLGVTLEQKKQFEAAAQLVGPEEIRAIEEAWTALLAEIRANRDLDPASPEAQSLARRWDELGERTMRGYQAFPELNQLRADSYKQGLYEGHPHAPQAADFAFIERVEAARRGHARPGTGGGGSTGGGDGPDP